MHFPCRSNANSDGFTLLEVIIAMAILVFIAFAIFQATTETYKLRDTLSKEGNFYNSIRLATTVMWRDISLIYSPIVTIDYAKPNPNNPPPAQPSQQDMQVMTMGDNSQTFQFWEPALDGTGLRPARFVGTETKLTFVTLSHIRIYKDTPESEFAKVTYELKPEPATPDNPSPTGSVLIKAESPNAFATEDSKDQSLRTYEVLHNVKKLSYTYYQRDGNSWKTSKSWDSDKTETKNQIPDYIELQLDVVGPKNQIFEGRYKFRPEIPFYGLNSST